MASDELSDHDASGKLSRVPAAQLLAPLYALSAAVTISLLILFYNIRISLTPSILFGAEQKDDERGQGLEIWEHANSLRWKWEPHVAKAIEKHLFGQGRAIDVGAFVGYYTVRLAKAAASFDVYAFEGRPPSDLNYNIKRNNTVNIHIVPETVDENWKLSTQLELDLLNEEGDKGPLALIKDDCEGCEFHFLEGAKKVLQKYHPVMIIEIKDDESPRNAKEGGQRKIKQTKTREDVLNWLANDLGCIVESMRDDDGAET